MNTLEATEVKIPKLDFEQRQTTTLGPEEMDQFASLIAEGQIVEPSGRLRLSRSEAVGLLASDGVNAESTLYSMLRYADVFYEDVITDLWNEELDIRKAIGAIADEVDSVAFSMLRDRSETVVVPTNVAIGSLICRYLYDPAADAFRATTERPRVGAVKATLLGSVAFLASSTKSIAVAGV